MAPKRSLTLSSDSDTENAPLPSTSGSSKRFKPSMPSSGEAEVIDLVSSSPVPVWQKGKVAVLSNTSSVDSVEIRKAKKKSKEKVKASKSKQRKLPMWEDLKGIKKAWGRKRGELRGLPLEVMDRIVSYDSDLELRDHLALAGTCRSFRTFYRDVVFQVPFAFHYPNVRLPAQQLVISTSGSITLPPRDLFIGPLIRSPFEARKIFTNNDAHFDPSSPADHTGWGVPNDVWATDPRRGDEQTLPRHLEKLRTAYELEVRRDGAKKLREDMDKWEEKVRKMAGEKALKSDFVVGVGRRPEPMSEWWVGEKVRSRLKEQITVFGDWIDTTGSVIDPKAVRDPWASDWRARCAEVVNRTLLHKTTAMKYYRLTAENLDFLTARLHPGSNSLKSMHYIEASLSSLALRLHGGVAGHIEHCEKVEAKVAKQLATKAENARIAQEEAEEAARLKAMMRSDGFGAEEEEEEEESE